MRCLSFQCDAQSVGTAAQRDAHVDRLCERVEHEAGQGEGLDLVLLPELSTIAYSEANFARLDALAEGLDGPSVERFAQLASDLGACVVFGMPRVDTQGRYYISQIAVDRDGALRGYYDKIHVAQFGASAEKRWFQRGAHSLVFELAGWRVGVLICYDMRFAGFASRMVQSHALDVVLHPVAFTQDGSWPSWHAFVQTRALENQVYWLSLNRAGPGWGKSILCPPWVDDVRRPVVFDEAESCHVYELSRQAIEYARSTYPFRGDTLESYDFVERAEPSDTGLR